MQRLVYLRTGTSRLFQVVGVNHLKNSKLLYEKQNIIFNRCLSTKKNNDSNNPKDVDTHPDLYKPSTAKQETHVPDDLKGGQSPETFETKSPLKSGGKVWSAQNPDGVHVPPLGRAKSTKFVSTATEGGNAAHQTTVYSTKGRLNIADPFKTHTFQPEATPAQSAEAAAASAFEPFAPDTPLSSTPMTEAVFAPKISSTQIHSSTSSPTAHFDSAVPSSSSSQQDAVKYEISQKGKVFGGQDTSADSKKRPKENPFNLKEQIKPNQAK